MNHNLIKCLIFLLFFTQIAGAAFAQVIAFPGAEGYGRFATGGRGDGNNNRNEVIEVTTLEDDAENPPEGSLRWAFKQAIEEREDPILGTYLYPLPITVVFRVGGVINLQDELRVDRNNITIAGQTAPGDGICIRGATVNFSGSNNLIIQHIRFRPGDEQGYITSAFRIENGGNFIIDHCSMSWTIEEATHFSSNSHSTVQWCIISESLYSSYHPKGSRGYATQWGGEYASYHHNLLAHHNSRMPRINGSNPNDIESLVDYRNNVNYNWRSTGAFYGGEWENTNGQGFCHTNVVNNYFKPGPATSGTVIFARPSLNRQDIPLDGYAGWFFSGNIMEGYPNLTNDNWLGVDGSEVGGTNNIRSDEEFVQSDGELEMYDNYTHSAENAYDAVLNYAGAILPVRDAIDARVVAEVAGEVPVVRYEYLAGDTLETPVTGTSSGIIDTPANLVPDSLQETTTAWDIYTTSTDAPLDTDHDGIPDDWELAHNLDPMNYDDGRIITGNGYSNLEIYLHGLLVTSTHDVEEAITNFKIYPNPTSGQLTIESDQPIVRVDILGLEGKHLMTVENDGGISTIQVSRELPVGIYILKASTVENLSITRKVQVIN